MVINLRTIIFTLSIWEVDNKSVSPQKQLYFLPPITK